MAAEKRGRKRDKDGKGKREEEKVEERERNRNNACLLHVKSYGSLTVRLYKYIHKRYIFVHLVNVYKRKI